MQLGAADLLNKNNKNNSLAPVPVYLTQTPVISAMYSLCIPVLLP
jgi:hypothetical protein